MKKIFLILIFILLILTSYKGLVYAAEANEGQYPVCLKVEKCNKVECSARARGTGELAHNGRLYAGPTPPISGLATYVMTCVYNKPGEGQQEGDFVGCTTGDRGLDQTLFMNTQYLDDLISNYNYQYFGFWVADEAGDTPQSNPVPAETPFGIYEWYDKTGGTPMDRKFYGINIIPETYSDPNLASGAVPTGEADSQQQGTLGFDQVTVIPTPGGDAVECDSIKWDPLGRIFDNNTLEPIAGAQVTLFMKRKDGSFTPVTNKDVFGGIKNPATTQEDGAYYFLVPEGDYKITVSHPDYSFPTEKTKINSAYQKIYSNIYPGLTGDVIVEKIDTPEERAKGQVNPESRDIPMEPKNSSKETEIKLMEYFFDKQKSSGKSTIDGRVSHPFAELNLYSVKIDPATMNKIRYRLLKSAVADRQGRFLITVDETNFSAGEMLGELEYNKTNLVGGSNSIKITKTLKLNPILNYLEGYAYDESGRVLANATVGVYLKFSNKPYYTTKTDLQGYYKIGSEHLPFLPYVIKYTAANGTTIKITTAQFVSQNDQFLSGRKVNLNDYKNDAGQTPAKKTSFPASSANKNPAKSTTAASGSNEILLIVFVIFILIGGVALIAGVYLHKKNTGPGGF